MVTFFSRYISIEGKPPIQPMSILQERYYALQHKIDKQAQIKSIKGWFNDTKHMMSTGGNQILLFHPI